MLTKEIGEKMLKNLMETIVSISDKEYQKRVWIQGNGPEIDDFDETVCKFFDNGNPILNEYRKCDITENQYQILKKFYDRFSIFSDNNGWPPFFIDSPEWNEIINMAKEVLKAFHYSWKKGIQ